MPHTAFLQGQGDAPHSLHAGAEGRMPFTHGQGDAQQNLHSSCRGRGMPLKAIMLTWGDVARSLHAGSGGAPRSLHAGSGGAPRSLHAGARGCQQNLHAGALHSSLRFRSWPSCAPLSRHESSRGSDNEVPVCRIRSWGSDSVVCRIRSWVILW